MEKLSINSFTKISYTIYRIDVDFEKKGKLDFRSKAQSVQVVTRNDTRGNL